MIDFTAYKSIPVGSLITQDPKVERRYMDQLMQLPPGLVNIVLAPETGAYIHGLMRNYNLAVELSPKVAFILLRVSVGDMPLAKLPVALSAELQISSEKAQELSQEIEKDLLEPVMDEIMNMARQQRQTQTGISSHGAEQVKRQFNNPNNVLDLKNVKNQPRPPQPPPIPGRNNLN